MRISDWSSDVCSSDLFLDLGDRVCVDQRTDRHAPVEPVTDLKARDRRHELGGEGVIDAVLNEETVGAYAGLAGIAELGRERPLDRRVEIGGVEDDEGGVAPELEADRKAVGVGQGWVHTGRTRGAPLNYK